MVSCKSSVSFVAMLVFALSGASYTGSAYAQSAQEITNELSRSTNLEMSAEQMIMDDLSKKVVEGVTGIERALIEQQGEELKRNKESNPIEELLTIFTAMPMANATVDQITQDIMFNRHREMNRVEIKDRADYMIDTSLPVEIDAQAFDIFMRYFCDPKGRGGEMADVKIAKRNVDFKGSKVDYELGCGYTSMAQIPSRRTVLGDKADVGYEADQVIGLPTRPDILFLSPTTFPTKASTGGATESASNSNRLAHIYYAAFSQSLLFLLGTPPSAKEAGSTAGSLSGYISTQGQIARRMMATYPFAIMFAERMGTMGPDVAQATADLLREKLGPVTEDETIYSMIENIERRNTISKSEYMDIMMNQLLLSPNYYARINEELSPVELRREAVWLSSMQTALNYQRNRWLEILAALEAVN